MMRIAMTGSTGLIGSSLLAALSEGGHEVIRLVRSPTSISSADHESITWNPTGEMQEKELKRLDGTNAIVHLAGENIAGGRWTDARMKRIHDSRVIGTRNLVNSIMQMEMRPKAFICASAIGFYGPHGDETIGEDDARGTGFLAEVCEEWECETNRLEDCDVRVVNARFGIVLSPRGGALKKMLLPFKMGVGGIIGTGRQWYSWISLDDCVGALCMLIENEDASGPINLVAPRPETNRDFTKVLGKVLKRPTILPMPTFAARLAFSRKMADETILTGARAEPRRLTDLGYEFQHPELEEALRNMVGKRKS